MTDAKTFFSFLIGATLVAALSFIVIGPFNMHIEGDIYVAQIEQFEAGELTLESSDVAIRAFKPLSGVWGSLLVPLFSPEEALQLMNLLFLLGLPFVAYGFLSELGFSRKEAGIGALWITAGYPVLKYGLALSTDMGGWFFALASAYFVLRGIREHSVRVLILASLLGFLGGAIKEPGVFGLVFGGLYILFTSRVRPIKETVIFLLALALPALILESLLFATLIIAGFPSFLDWYGLVINDDYLGTHYKITKLVGVLGSTFSMLLVYASVGIVSVIRHPAGAGEHPYARTFALLFASLPVLLWTIFISRVLYIQFLFVVPMALLGVRTLLDVLPTHYRKVGSIVLYALPIVCAVLLFILAGRKSLFDVLF